MAYVLFISEAKLKDSTAINLNVDPEILLPYVLQAQRIYIEPKIASHGGSVAGYTAHMAFDPEARIGVVLLRNYGRGSTNLGTAAQSLVAQLRSSIR